MGLRINHQGGRSHDLTGEVTIGREAGCTVVLADDAAVSRRHARFLWLHGLPMIEDLGSRNGTLLNGARVTQARPVSSGDEIRVGSAVFRVEAVLDSTEQKLTAAAPAGAKEASRSERRKAGGRRSESGSAEGSLYGNPGGGDSLPGCGLPNIDLGGCLKYLWIVLLVLLAAVLIGLILFGVGALLSAVSGAGSSVSGAGGSGGSVGSGGSADGNQPVPPQIGSSPPPAGQSQDNPPQQQGQGIEGIHIEQVKIDFAKRGEVEAKPVVLIKWINLTKKPVKRLSGTVYLYDREGKAILEIPREKLFEGVPVNPGESHQDTLQQGGVVIRRALERPPVSATVKVEQIE